MRVQGEEMSIKDYLKNNLQDCPLYILHQCGSAMSMAMLCQCGSAMSMAML